MSERLGWPSGEVTAPAASTGMATAALLVMDVHNGIVERIGDAAGGRTDRRPPRGEPADGS